MADEAHIAVLKQGADAWNAWRAAHAGTPADLANASLRGLELAKANLAGADCRKADLRGAILSGAAGGRSTDEVERARLADQIQVRAYQVVQYINGGQWKQYTAVRTNVSGLGETTVPVFWEVAKEG